MTRFIIPLIVLILLIIAFIIAQEAFAPSTGPNDRATSTEMGDGPSSDEAERIEFTSEPVAGFRFSLQLPERVEVSRIDDARYEFKYIGPESEPNTEITDGYYLSAYISTTSAALDTYAADRAQGEVVDASIAGRAAVRYQTVSELNNRDVAHRVVSLPEHDAVIDFSFTTHGERSARYESEVVDIIQSLVITTVDATADGGTEQNDLIQVDAPSFGESVTSPLQVSGQARGTWFFEASFPLVLVDWDGRIIAEHYATAEGEWMTEDFVPFTAEIDFESPYQAGDPDFMRRGTLILQRANPSGLPENDDAVEVVVEFTADES